MKTRVCNWTPSAVFKGLTPLCLVLLLLPLLLSLLLLRSATLVEASLAMLGGGADVLLVHRVRPQEKLMAFVLGLTESSMLVAAACRKVDQFGSLAAASGLVSVLQVLALSKAAAVTVAKNKAIWQCAWVYLYTPNLSLTMLQSPAWLCLLVLCFMFILLVAESDAEHDSSERLGILLRAVPGLVVLDSGQKVELLSPTLESLLGDFSEADKKLGTLLCDDSRSLKSKLQALEQKNQGDIGIVKLQTQVFAVQAAKAGDSTVIHFTDISALWRSEESARSEISAKTTLLRSVTHELRTPLNAVINLIQDIVDTEHVSDTGEEKLRIANTSSKLLLHLVNDILDMSQMMAGALRVVHSDFNVREVLRDIADLFSYQCEKRGLILELDLSPSVPMMVSTDPHRLSQVLTNLLSNALKFTKEGGIYVKVDLVGNILKTQVRDTGIGMSQQGIRQLFQPFAKLDDPEHLNSQGCGLGLNICYGLVKALGGNGIQVQSVLGVGSTFEFSIPVVIVSHELSRKLTITRQISWIPSKLEDLHVLVVDDSTFNTMTVKMMLGAFDIRCTEAYSAPQAISLLASDDSYVLVLMDLEMPEMDGYEGLARLLEMEEEGEVTALPPIVACSANPADTERPKALSAGFTEYAEKPLSKSMLLALLRAFSSTD